VGLWSCLAAVRSGKTTVLVADSAHKECHVTSTGCRSGIRRITSLQPLRLANGASPLKQTGEEAAMPGQPERTHARFRIPAGNSPSRIASLPPASPQSSVGKLRLTTYSLHPLCSGMFEAATEKQFPLVQKLWTTKLPCGGLRKTAEESQEGT
jgi:hypothetical protein